ncbi:uncharacterized protein [Dermacentor andersoni]|uniref:uncharacterized protein n=1 Tax=Dermacentor andersoni TaxID=34620 RepID=UPI002415E106|nr:titin-like [Dermacentor andersoni]
MDFPSTIGTDTKLDAELRHPVRSAETVGEGKTEDALVVTRLQGEATVAPTTMESSVGEPQIAKAVSDLERDKKPVLASADEVTVYTSFSDSSAPKQEPELAKLPFPSEGAEEEMVRLAAPGTSRQDVIKSVEEAHRPLPFKTPEETTAGSEVEDTLVERAGLHKQVEELSSKALTHAETVEPRGDWEGPAGQKPEADTVLTKQPPKRRVSTQVSESQASEWRIVERPVPFGSENQQVRTRDDQALRATEDHITVVGPTIAEILIEAEVSVKSAGEELPAAKERHAAQEYESRQLAEPLPTYVAPRQAPEIEVTIAEMETAATEAKTAEVAKREEPLPPTVPEPREPYIESFAPQAPLTEAQELTQRLSEQNVLLRKAGVEEKVSEKEAIPQADTALPVRRRSSVLPLTESTAPGYRRKSSDIEAGEGAQKEPSYIETSPALESFQQEALPIPSYEETTPYIESFAPEALLEADQELKRKRSEANVVYHEAGAQEKITKAEPPPPSLTTLKARRHSSITPPTAALVPGYRRKSSAREAAEAAKKEPSYIETSPALESFPQEAPPIPSYKETTPYIESFAPQALLTEADTAMPVRRHSSVLPLTQWIVPGYRRKSSDIQAGEAAQKEPSYIETSPALESFPQEAPPIPSYEETTPYIESFAPEALLKADQELKRKRSEAKVVHHEVGGEKEITKVEPRPPSLATLKARRHSSITPPTAALVPGYRRRSSAREAAEAAKEEPSYIETSPALESFPQEAPPIPSYEETTPYIESFAPEALFKADQELKRKGSEAEVVHHEVGAEKEIPKVEPRPPSVATLKARRHSSITPPTAALVPGYRRRSSAREAAEAAKEEPSYIETSPALESFPQEAPPIPSYEETTPYIESFAPEALFKADQELKRKGSEAEVVHHEVGAEKEIPKVEPRPPSLATLKARRHSSITPPTAALVPGYRRRSSAREAAEAAKEEPSYIETTPALESFPQEAPPIPSYKETTPYIESFAPQALLTEADTAMPVRRRSSVLPLTEWIVPEYHRKSSDVEAREAAQKEPSYIETSPALESFPQEAPPIPSYEETTPYIESFAPEALLKADQELKRKGSEAEVVHHEVGAGKEITKVEPRPPSLATLKARRHSSITPPTAALVPGYRRRSSAREAAEAAKEEPSYIETSPALESFPQEAPPIPSYEETTPYIESFAPEALLKADQELKRKGSEAEVVHHEVGAEKEITKVEPRPPSLATLKARRHSSITPPTAALVPGYRRRSSAREAAEAAKKEPSYIETSPALESFPQEAPPIPSYEETTPYIESFAPEALFKADQELKRKLSEGKVVHYEVGAEKEITKAEPPPPSLTTLKARRRSSIMPPTAAVVPGYRRRSSAREAAEAAKKEPTYIETTPILQSYPQEAPPTTSYAETTPYIESFPPASSVVDAKALGPPVPVEKRPALDLRKVSSDVQEWALMELRPPTGTEITEKKETRLAVVDRGEAEGRVLPAFKMGESAEGSLIALSTSAEEKPFAGGLFSHVSMPTSRKRSRQVSDVTGLKRSEGAAMQEGEEITVTVRDYEADHEEQPSSVGTQSSQEEEELEKSVRKEKLALALYDEKVPTVVLEAKKHAEMLAPEEARLKPVPLKPEVKESQPFAPVPEDASSLVELAQPLVIRPESAMVRAEQPVLADELLPTAEEVVPVERAVEEWKPASVVAMKPEPVELSEGVARPVAEEIPRIPSEVAEVGELQEEKPKFAPISKPPESDAERPEQDVYVTVLTPKHDEPLRVLAGMPVITEPTKLPPVATTERTHHISAPWSTRSSVAAAEEAARGRAAWEQELTRAGGTDRRIERLHEKKTAKYSVIIKDGQPVRSISSSLECTEPVKEDFPDSLSYQYVASEEQVLERIVTVDSTESISVPAHPPSDKQPPGPGTQGDASSAHTAPPGPERFQPKQREEPRSEGPTSESEFKPEEAAPSTNAPEEMVAASVQAAVQEQKEGSSFEIGIPIDEQTEFPTMKEDLEKEDQQLEETTSDAGFEEFSAARHVEKVPKARPSTVESSTALESGEQPLALEYLPVQIDTHVSTTPAPSRMPLLAQLVKAKDEATFEPEEDVLTTKTFEKDYMITVASQRSDQEATRPLTAASKKVAFGTTELEQLQSDPELPQIEHTLSRTAVVEEKPNLDTELTAPGVLPQQKVKDEIGHEEAAGQTEINEATVPESDGHQFTLTEHVEPTCPPQPEIAVKEEIPALEALPESDQPQVQVSAQAKPLAEAPLYVHPALTEPQKLAALDETTAIVEVRPRGLEPTKDRPQVDYHAPVQATKGERKELRPMIAESVEFKIHQPDKLALPEVVEKSSQDSVPRTAQKQISEAPSIYDADVEAKKQQTALMLSIEAPGGVRASLSQTEPPVKEVPTVAAEEQVGFSAPKETEVAIGEALTEPTARPAVTGPVEEPKAEVTSEAAPSMQRVPGAPAAVTTGTLVPRIETALDVHATQGVDLTPIKSEHWPVEAMIARPPLEPGRALAGAAQVKEEVTAEDYVHTTPPPAAVLPTKVPQEEEGAELCEAPKGVAVTPMIPEAARLLEPDTATQATKQATEGTPLSHAPAETAVVEGTKRKYLEHTGARLAIEHLTPEAGTKEVKLATAGVTAVKEEITTHQVAEKAAQALVEVEMPDALVVATDKWLESVVPVSEEQVIEIPDALSDVAPASTGTVQSVTHETKLEKFQQSTTAKTPEKEPAQLPKQQITEMLQISTEDQLRMKPSQDATAVTESRTMSQTERAQRQQTLQAFEVPSIEVRSAGDFSSEGTAVLVDVEDVDEEHEYHEEVREKRSTSIASMLRESPATIMAQLNVASSKPESPAERKGEAVLEPRFHTPHSEEELDKTMIAGAITDLSIVPEEITKSLTDFTESTNIGPLPALRQASAPDLQSFQEKEPEATALKALDQIGELSIANAVVEKPLPTNLAEKPSTIEHVAKKVSESHSDDAILTSTPSSYVETTPYMAAYPVEPAPIVVRPEVAGLLQEHIVLKKLPQVEIPQSIITTAAGQDEKETKPAVLESTGEIVEVLPAEIILAEKEPAPAVEPALIVERPEVTGLQQEDIAAKVPPEVEAPVYLTTATAEAEKEPAPAVEPALIVERPEVAGVLQEDIAAKVPPEVEAPIYLTTATAEAEKEPAPAVESALIEERLEVTGLPQEDIAAKVPPEVEAPVYLRTATAEAEKEPAQAVEPALIVERPEVAGVLQEDIAAKVPPEVEAPIYLTTATAEAEKEPAPAVEPALIVERPEVTRLPQEDIAAKVPPEVEAPVYLTTATAEAEKEHAPAVEPALIVERPEVAGLLQEDIAAKVPPEVEAPIYLTTATAEAEKEPTPAVEPALIEERLEVTGLPQEDIAAKVPPEVEAPVYLRTATAEAEKEPAQAVEPALIVERPEVTRLPQEDIAAKVPPEVEAPVYLTTATAEAEKEHAPAVEPALIVERPEVAGLLQEYIAAKVPFEVEAPVYLTTATAEAEKEPAPAVEPALIVERPEVAGVLQEDIAAKVPPQVEAPIYLRTATAEAEKEPAQAVEPALIVERPEVTGLPQEDIAAKVPPEVEAPVYLTTATAEAEKEHAPAVEPALIVERPEVAGLLQEYIAAKVPFEVEAPVYLTTATAEAEKEPAPAVEPALVVERPEVAGVLQEDIAAKVPPEVEAPISLTTATAEAEKEPAPAVEPALIVERPEVAGLLQEDIAAKVPPQVEAPVYLTTATAEAEKEHAPAVEPALIVERPEVTGLPQEDIAAKVPPEVEAPVYLTTATAEAEKEPAPSVEQALIVERPEVAALLQEDIAARASAEVKVPLYPSTATAEADKEPTPAVEPALIVELPEVAGLLKEDIAAKALAEAEAPMYLTTATAEADKEPEQAVEPALIIKRPEVVGLLQKDVAKAPPLVKVPILMRTATSEGESKHEPAVEPAAIVGRPEVAGLLQEDIVAKAPPLVPASVMTATGETERKHEPAVPKTSGETNEVLISETILEEPLQANVPEKPPAIEHLGVENLEPPSEGVIAPTAPSSYAETTPYVAACPLEPAPIVARQEMVGQLQEIPVLSIVAAAGAEVPVEVATELTKMKPLALDILKPQQPVEAPHAATLVEESLPSEVATDSRLAIEQRLAEETYAETAPFVRQYAEEGTLPVVTSVDAMRRESLTRQLSETAVAVVPQKYPYSELMPSLEAHPKETPLEIISQQSPAPSDVLPEKHEVVPLLQVLPRSPPDDAAPATFAPTAPTEILPIEADMLCARDVLDEEHLWGVVQEPVSLLEKPVEAASTFSQVGATYLVKEDHAGATAEVPPGKPTQAQPSTERAHKISEGEVLVLGEVPTAATPDVLRAPCATVEPYAVQDQAEVQIYTPQEQHTPYSKATTAAVPQEITKETASLLEQTMTVLEPLPETIPQPPKAPTPGETRAQTVEAAPEILPVSVPGIPVVQALTEITRAGDAQLAIPKIEEAPGTSVDLPSVETMSLVELHRREPVVLAEEQELREKSVSARAEEPPERLPQGITTVPALEPHAGLASQLSQVEPTSLAIAGAKDSLALMELAAPHTEPSAAKPELTEQPQEAFVKEEQLTYFPSTKPTTRAASLDIAEAALQSAVKVVEEKVREAAEAAEREAKKVEEEEEAASVTAAPALPIEVVKSVSATPGTVPTQPVGDLVAAISGAIDDMRAEAPGVSESELAIAEALRASREEARVQGIVAEAVPPQLEQQEAEFVSLESLARPLISEREMDQAQVSGTVLPPSETKTYAEFQKSLKASSATTVPSTGTVALRRLTAEYPFAVPDAELSKVHADSGESATVIEPALQRPLAEKEEEEIRELAVAAVMVAAASAAVNAQQQREMSALREPSVTGSMISATSEVPIASTVAREIRQKLAGELEVLPSASRTALVDVLAAGPPQEPDFPNAIVGPPSTISTSWSTEDAGRLRRHSSRDRSEEFRVPETLVPALDDEIHVPRPTSFNVPVINIQYNFHFPRPDSPGAPGRQSPPSPEQAMAAQVLQGALAQQGMAGHIPGHHVLSPEQQALREMTERLNRVALHGSEPYTGRQSPGKGTMFRPLPRKPVPPVPPLMPPGDEMSAEERKRLCGFRFIVCLLAFLMIVFVLLYCLGLIGNKRYFMYYS